MLGLMDKSIDGMTAVISGSGNVAQFTAQKITDLGGKVN
jgi:glutamate dehydrogenase (NADP+)